MDDWKPSDHSNDFSSFNHINKNQNIEIQDKLTEIGKQRRLEFNVALNPSPKAPVKFHFKIDGRHVNKI